MIGLIEIVLCSAGGDAAKDRLSFRRNFMHEIFVPLSQCHRGVLISHSQYKLGGKALHTIRKTRRCDTPTWRRAQNAVLLKALVMMAIIMMLAVTLLITISGP
jgi:hypothetical protein